MDDLESKIAVGLTARETTSADLKKLVEQVTVAAQAADEEATQQRQKALDPTRVIDTQAVSAAIVDAELKRDRLREALPRLHGRFVKAEAAERYATWVIDYDRVQAQRDAAAQELRALYAPLVIRLADLLGRIEAIDAEVARVNNSKSMNADAANGDGRILYGVETCARGAGRFNETIRCRIGLQPTVLPGRPIGQRCNSNCRNSRKSKSINNNSRFASGRALAGEVERQAAAE
jgi:hypothetical protein